MIDKILTWMSALIIAAISALGYGGIVLMMGIESACIPLPSEVTMPFSGYLVATGRFGLNMVAIAYFVGANGGRRFLERYGRWVLIAPHEIEIADQFFDRWGSAAVFFSRLLPVVRTFIAFPAGVARMRLLPFTIYTLAGSYIWCWGLAYAGMKLGENWNELSPYFHRFDTAIALLIAAGGGWLLYNRWKGLSALRPGGQF
jgi:membrane protein DedA with SNARE-associated domain